MGCRTEGLNDVTVSHLCDGISPILSMSAQEDRNDFSCTPKCLQWPQLYDQSYEATYTLKCLLSEIIAKYQFSFASTEKSVFRDFLEK